MVVVMMMMMGGRGENGSGSIRWIIEWEEEVEKD